MTFIFSIFNLFSFTAGGSCSYSGARTILGLPYWYEYLPGQYDSVGRCLPSLSSISDIWLVVAAIIEILLRVAAIAAIVMLVYGGIQFITSQGNPTNTQKAQSTVINALIGLVIAVAAAAIVSFIAGKF